MHVPNRACYPKCYRLPKYTKMTPLVSIVLSRHSVTYVVAKIIEDILKPLGGKSQHHIQNTQHFVEQIKDITLGPGECITSYDITTIFTSIPVNPVFNIVKKKSEQNQDLHLKPKLMVKDIIEL